MARQAINIGSSANDGTGDPLRTAFDKINDNFIELYGTDNDINTLDANLNVNNFQITTGVTNGDITVTPNGTGSIKLGSFKFNVNVDITISLGLSPTIIVLQGLFKAPFAFTFTPSDQGIKTQLIFLEPIAVKVILE